MKRQFELPVLRPLFGCVMGVALLGILMPGSTLASGLRETPIGESAERHLPDGEVMLWSWDADASSAIGGDRLEQVEVETVAPETVKLTDVVPPITFESGVANIPESTVSELKAVLEGMRDKHNVRINLVGHADNQPLSPELAEVYGDNIGLSQARAGQVAEYFKNTLGLPGEAISFEWAGDTRPVASNETAAGRAKNRRVEVEVWYDELKDAVAYDERLVVDDMARIKVCRIETVCKLRYVDGHERRARVVNLVAPLHYDDGSIELTDGFVGQIQQTLDNLADKQHVVVKFIGYTDDQPLSGQAASIYGNHEAFSKARARRVALAIQDALGLETQAVASDGHGAERPLASNATLQGRSLNRRIEVEFWYDDPLKDLPDEPQLCPGEPGAATVTKVYDPPWGEIPKLELESGSPIVPAGFDAVLKRALGDVSDKTNPRLRFVGYTRNETLDRRTASVYGDDIGLSAARARRAMETVAGQMGLLPEAEFEGRGYVVSDDVVNAGFIQGEDSYVAVEVVYDDLAVLDDLDGVAVTPLTRELEPKNPFALNLMRITVDGEPIDDPNRSSADVQRCTDVAMKRSDIRFTFDNLSSSPRLSVAASPTVVPLHGDGAGGMTGDPIAFRMYANYGAFIDRAEIRIFDRAASTQAVPRDVVAVDADGLATWEPTLPPVVGAAQELKYVLRAYGPDGSFDETDAQALWMVHDNELDAIDANVAEYFEDLGDPGYGSGIEPASPDPLRDHALLAEYGENALSMHNIRLSSGTVRVHGGDIPAGHQVYVAGHAVPVDAAGNFVSEQVLPEGAHSVEVAVVDEAGRGESYLRDVAFEPNDWFYVGMADLTLSYNSSDDAMKLLEGQNAPYDLDSSADGRLAFFVNGKFGDHWRLTASADSREEPIEDLFSNFTEKSPDALLRRMDPDYHYPTFGDDGTVEELAPTSGKVYAKLARRNSYGMWGNFTVGYMENELAQIDRGLYGGMLHYETQSTTRFGEERLSVDGFGAQPDTVASREEFRGTGGSLYFLKHQDLMVGSERVRIEIRDRASGLVTGVVNLSPTLDYDIDYLQGTVLLAEPLSATVSDNLLVRSGALSGDEAYLVTRYEYAPGLEDIDAMSTGGQAHVWLNDFLRVGVTASSGEQEGEDNSLNGFDVIARKNADSWVKVQASRSEGLGSDRLLSNDGGFAFVGYDPAQFTGDSADAYRADVSLGFADVLPKLDGRMTAYVQDRQAGFAAPGMATVMDTENYGGTLELPMGSRLTLFGKLDQVNQDEGIQSTAGEVDVTYQLSRRWDLSTGVRHDKYENDAPLAVPNQNDGARTDGVVQLGYDSEGLWSAYGFVQDTLEKDGNREDNGRVGVGSAVRLSEKMSVDMEVSDGDLGPGGRLGTTYMQSERTSLYLNYTLENERQDPVLRAPGGSEGTLVSGVKTRLSDSTSLFLEERYRHGSTASGLTHATGVNFATADRWSLGANTDIGKLQDLVAGTETDRKAVGVRVGYGTDALQLSSGIEYRRDNTEQADLTNTERTTWLFRNNFKLQMTESARLLGKLNHADSDSSLGDFFAGGYTEAVLGFGYRPVSHDRLDALAKYTYFYNLPSSDQVSSNGQFVEYLQKSHIASLDVTYDLTSRWTIGGKYAYRLGQVSMDRDNPDYFDNSAALYILRADWRIRQNWEVLMEGRLLDMTDLDEQRYGTLFALSRYFGDHFKVGLGYNFTDFSSDLTDLSFKHHGTFINFTGVL